MKLKNFCTMCKKNTTHEPDASVAITNYAAKPHVSWQCRICYPNGIDKRTSKNI